MKLANKFSLFLFIIILIIALCFNILIIKDKKGNTNIDIFKPLSGIYFDLSMIDNKEAVQNINLFLNSDNINLTNALIKNNDNPTGQFYAFCSLMKINQKAAITTLNSLLTSSNKVNIYPDKNTKLLKNDLGYAILLLLNNPPENLLKKPDKDFYSKINQIILNAYKSDIAKTNKLYKKDLIVLISDKSPELFNELSQGMTNNKPYDQLNDSEKLELSFYISSVPKNEREFIIKRLLSENNETILLNTLSNIKGDNSLETADLILNIYYKNISKEITSLASDKFLLVAIKNKDAQRVHNFMRNGNEANILSSLEKIGEYGDYNFYELLKLYLTPSYADLINITALKSIFKTTYTARPDDVRKTINFILLNINKDILVLESIKFNIDKNDLSNSGSILYRLRSEDSLKNKELKMVALQYINHFNLSAGVDLLKTLSNDTDYDVRIKANELLNNKFKNY